MDPGVAAHTSGGERLGGPGAANAVNIGQRDLKPLLTRQVNARETCHLGAVLLRIVEVLRAASRPCPRWAPASNRGLRPAIAGPAACGARVPAYLVFSVPASWPPSPARMTRTGGCGGRPLPLALLVPGVRADHHDAAVATDDPALAADLLDARLDLHGELLLSGGVEGPPSTRCKTAGKVAEDHRTAFCMIRANG